MSSLINRTLLVLLSAGLTFLFNLSHAQNKKELEQKKQQLQKDIKLTNRLLDETKVNKKLSLNQLVTLNKKISIREELIGTINDEINVLDRQIAINKSQLSQLETDLKSLKDEYAKMIYFAYKNKSAYDRMMFIFSSKDFNQAYSRLKYLQQYTDYRQKQGELIIQTQQNINLKLKELSNKKNEKLGIVTEQEQEIGNLSGEKQEKEKVLVQLQDKEKQLKAELKKKQNDSRRLQQAIQQIIEEEIRKAKEEARKAAAEAEKKRIEANKSKKELPKGTKVEKTENVKSRPTVMYMSPEAEKLSSSFELNKSKLPWPVSEGVIVEGFGEHEHPVLKGIKIKNNGVDIQTNKNAMARCIFEGEVSGVVSIPNAGIAVIVRHGEFLSVYSNLNEVYVNKGDKLKTKQTIGTIERDEESGKTEVHFEIWKGNVMLNPELWIGKRN